MQRYLAEKYMSGPKAEAILSRDPNAKQKKKRKHASSSIQAQDGLSIVDDDAGWGRPIKSKDTGEDEDDDLKEAVIASDRSFKKRKKGEGWVTLGPDGKPIQQEQKEEVPEDEKPLVVAAPMVGGLMSHTDLEKQFGAQTLSTMKKDREGPTEREMETVYRDASGRKIDTKAAKAEAARRKREEEEKEAKKMEWGKGLVQREDHERRRKEMEEERGKGFERRRDDKTLNQSQKDELRWNDPAAAFLTKQRTKGPKKPEYQGPPPPPNRFGIKPGYRWDGVDRSNGFEKKLFQKQNERQRKGLEAYKWSVDEM